MKNTEVLFYSLYQNLKTEKYFFEVEGFGKMPIAYDTAEEAQTAAWDFIHDQGCITEHDAARGEDPTKRGNQ